MYGKGLLDGLKVTGRIIFRKKITEKYPEEKPELTDRWKGWFQLDVDKCIACGLCEKACPNSAIKTKVEKDENNKRRLTGYEIQIPYCLFCGLCVEACPKKCLSFTKEFEHAKYFKDQLILDLYNNPNLSAPTSTYGHPEKEKKAKAEAKEN